jgi:hypothetical protein
LRLLTPHLLGAPMPQLARAHLHAPKLLLPLGRQRAPDSTHTGGVVADE